MQQFSGKQYLQIDVASNFGLDKEDWDVRLNWFETNKDNLPALLDKAETPALFYAGVMAWNNALKGQASGYPVSLDATASGLQILACLTGDRSAAELCNVVNTGSRKDAYTEFYKFMLEKVGERAKLTREMVKQAVMTAFYASEAIPKEVFGKGALLNVFYATLEEKAPAAWALNTTYKDIWDGNRDTYEWVLPDNGHVVIKIMHKVEDTVLFLGHHYDVVSQVHAPTPEGRSLSANTTHSIDGLIVREIVRRCNYDPKVIKRVKSALQGCGIGMPEPKAEDAEMVEILWDHYQKSGFLSARILDYVDQENVCLVDAKTIWELIDSLPAKPFEVLAIHDCFRCLPNYANDLRKQYNLQLHLLAKSNMLSYLLSQIMGQEVLVEKLDETLADDILNTEYALS